MNIVKKLAFSSIAAVTILSPVAAGAAQAHGESKWKPSADCRQLRNSQQQIIDKIYFGSSWQLKKFQNLTNQQNDNNCKPRYSTVDYLERFNFKSLVASLKYTGLDKTLEGKGPFTVFAPTDDAFAKLPAGLVQSLLTDPAQKVTPSDILLYHVVGGAKVDAATASSLTSAATAGGKTVNITQKNGNLFINDSQVVLYDIMTTNGIIHVIDTVLVPSS